MQVRAAWFQLLFWACVWPFLAPATPAQTSPVIQFFVPGQGLPTHEVRFTLTINGFSLPFNTKSQILNSDAKGRYQLGGALDDQTYAISVEGDKRSYAITSLKLKAARNQTYLPVFLQPLPEASPYAGKPVEYDAAAPGEAAAAYEAAAKAVTENKLALAISELTRALMLHPTYLRALNLLGEVYLELKLPDLAAAALSQALSFNPKAQTPRLRLAMLWQAQGRYDQSLQLFSQILQDQPGLTSVRVSYAEALSATNQWDEAETQLREALKDPQLDAPSRANVHIKLGLKLNRDARPPAVAAEFTKAVEANPNSAQARLYLGAALIQIGQLTDAERELLKAYELGGKSFSNAQLLLGQVYEKQQKPELALRAYEQFLVESPNSNNAAVARAAVEKIKAGMKSEKK
jgi:tetratricopeptide (TPR) repeat protein